MSAHAAPGAMRGATVLPTSEARPSHYFSCRMQSYGPRARITSANENQPSAIGRGDGLGGGASGGINTTPVAVSGFTSQGT